MIVKGLASTDHPVLAHIIPMRRCNLACAYCNEYDDFSKPVPLDVMHRRIDHLADWAPPSSPSAAASRCCIPSSTRSSRRIRQHGMIAGMITNGYLLTADRIQRLNRAGLDTCRSPSTTSCRTRSRRRA